MRIDFFSSTVTTEAVAKTDKVSNDKVSTAKKQAVAPPASEDRTTLSSSSESVKSLTKTALQPVPSRQARVEALKLAVNNAQYQLDTAQIAAALSSSEV